MTERLEQAKTGVIVNFVGAFLVILVVPMFGGNKPKFGGYFRDDENLALKLKLTQESTQKLAVTTNPNSPTTQPVRESTFVNFFLRRKTHHFTNHFNNKIAHLRKMCSTEFADYKNKLCNNEIQIDPEIPPAIRVWCDKKPRLRGAYWIGDTSRRMSICMPLKSGCTSITRMWLAINNHDLNYLNFTLGNDASGKYNSGKIGKQFPQLNEKSFSRFRMNSYPWMNFINVRHPFERLYSGWKDKFGGNKKKGPYYRNYFEKVSGYNASRDHKLDYRRGQAPIVGFEQWLMYMADNTWEPINDHFKPIGYFCSPCEVNYDYVMSQEDLGDTLLEAFNYAIARQKDSETWVVLS